MANKGPVWVDPGFSAKRQARKARRFAERFPEIVAGGAPLNLPVDHHIHSLLLSNRGWVTYECMTCGKYLNTRNTNTHDANYPKHRFEANYGWVCP